MLTINIGLFSNVQVLSGNATVSVYKGESPQLAKVVTTTNARTSLTTLLFIWSIVFARWTTFIETFFLWSAFTSLSTSFHISFIGLWFWLLLFILLRFWLLFCLLLLFWLLLLNLSCC